MQFLHMNTRLPARVVARVMYWCSSIELREERVYSLFMAVLCVRCGAVAIEDWIVARVDKLFMCASSSRSASALRALEVYVALVDTAPCVSLFSARSSLTRASSARVSNGFCR